VVLGNNLASVQGGVGNMSCLQPRGLVSPDGWGAPYNGLYGEAPAERGTFSDLRYVKG